MYDSKYIIFEEDDLRPATPVLFPMWITHADVALNRRIGSRVKSAGFVRFVVERVGGLGVVERVGGLGQIEAGVR